MYKMPDKYLYTRQRAAYYASQGMKAAAISRMLASEGLSYTTKSASVLLKKLSRGEGISRKVGSGRRGKVTDRVKALIEEQMQTDDETTATELQSMPQ